MTARELGSELGIDKSFVNRVLYSHRDWFVAVGDAPPHWWNGDARHGDQGDDPGPRSRTGGSPRSQRGTTAGFRLYEWQRDALREWERAGQRGIVEAVTGAGKTALGIAAIERQLARGGKSAVVVPTIELLRQWTYNVEERIPGADVGALGGGHSDDLTVCDVLVAVAASASRYPLGLTQGVPGLLVADECHRYAGPQFRHALEEGFSARLGLSATYERSDGLHEDVLLPYFRRIVYQLDYRRAIDAGVVASFKVGLIPVAFKASERTEYEALSDQARRAKSQLVLQFGAPEEPFGEYIAFVNRLRTSGSRYEGMIAGRYLSAFAARRKLLAEAPTKLRALGALSPSLRAADRSIVFTETVAGANLAVASLRQRRLNAQAIHSQLKPEERRAVLAAFAGGSLKAIVAPRVLDEGVDVPAADLAVIMAASQQRRQMIQRMGRVLRRNADDRASRFAIVFVEGTSEDPKLGAHEAFLEEMLDVAADVHRFRLGASEAKLESYLAPAP